MTGERVERRLTAVLAADVAGYSRLMGRDEESTLAQLKAFRKTLLDPKIVEHRGRIVKTTGDGMLVAFASAVDAARCAVEVQRGMAGQNADVPQDSEREVSRHGATAVFNIVEQFGHIAAPDRFKLANSPSREEMQGEIAPDMSGRAQPLGLDVTLVGNRSKTLWPGSVFPALMALMAARAISPAML